MTATRRYLAAALLLCAVASAAAGSVFADSYRPALETCLAQLQAQLEEGLG